MKISNLTIAVCLALTAVSCGKSDNGNEKAGGIGDKLSDQSFSNINNSFPFQGQDQKQVNGGVQAIVNQGAQNPCTQSRNDSQDGSTSTQTMTCRQNGASSATCDGKTYTWSNAELDSNIQTTYDVQHRPTAIVANVRFGGDLQSTELSGKLSCTLNISAAVNTNRAGAAQQQPRMQCNCSLAGFTISCEQLQKADKAPNACTAQDTPQQHPNPQQGAQPANGNLPEVEFPDGGHNLPIPPQGGVGPGNF